MTKPRRVLLDLDGTVYEHDAARWARLIAKVYQADPLACTRCASA